MKHNHNMQLYARQKRLQKRTEKGMIQAIEQMAKTLMDNELSYTEFCAEYGEPYDWEYTKATCPRCGETYCLDNQEWE